MRIATIREQGAEACVIIDPDRGALRPQAIDPGFTGNAMDLIARDMETGVLRAAAEVADERFEDIRGLDFCPPYRHPRKIWGIGLNYRDHAADLDESAPDEPASFMKGDHTIIGPGDDIVLPGQSSRVTAEAELGLVIGREARNVSERDAMDYVWGVCPILDQTAEDILRRNPRFLTRAKNFPAFFSFGPCLVPLDEARAVRGSLGDITVRTVVNGDQVRSNTVSNMTHGLEFLVSFHSEVMPLFPGDIISTGTPGALVIEDGDVVECDIPGIGKLVNRVRREG